MKNNVPANKLSGKKLDEMIYKRLPNEAREAVESNPKKYKEMSKVIDQIFDEYGKDISELARN